MSVIEKDGILQYVDKNGNLYLLYPITKLDNVDGTDDLVQYVNDVLQTLGGEVIETGAKVEFGSYVGTQASSQTVMSESTATTIVFDKKPKLVILYRSISSAGRAIAIRTNNMCFVGALTETYQDGMGFYPETVSSKGTYAKYANNTLYYYETNLYVGSPNAYNQAGVTYEYMAIY